MHEHMHEHMHGHYRDYDTVNMSVNVKTDGLLRRWPAIEAAGCSPRAWPRLFRRPPPKPAGLRQTSRSLVARSLRSSFEWRTAQSLNFSSWWDPGKFSNPNTESLFAWRVLSVTDDSWCFLHRHLRCRIGVRRVRFRNMTNKHECIWRHTFYQGGSLLITQLLTHKEFITWLRLQ